MEESGIDSISSSYDSQSSMGSADYSAMLDYLAGVDPEDELPPELASLVKNFVSRNDMAGMDMEETEQWASPSVAKKKGSNRSTPKSGGKEPRPKGGWRSKLNSSPGVASPSPNRASRQGTPETPQNRQGSANSTPMSWGKKESRGPSRLLRFSPVALPQLRQKYDLPFVAAVDPISKLVDDDALIVMPHDKAMNEAFAATDHQHIAVEIVVVSDSQTEDATQIDRNAGVERISIEHHFPSSHLPSGESFSDHLMDVTVDPSAVDEENSEEDSLGDDEIDDEEESAEFDDDEDDNDIDADDNDIDADEFEGSSDLEASPEVYISSDDQDIDSGSSGSFDSDDMDDFDDMESSDDEAGSEDGEEINISPNLNSELPVIPTDRNALARRGMVTPGGLQLKHDTRPRRTKYSRQQAPSANAEFPSKKKLSKVEKKKQKKRDRDEKPLELHELHTWNELIRDFIEHSPHGTTMPFSPMGRLQRKQLHWLSEFYGLRSQSFGSGTRRMTHIFVTKKTILPDLTTSLVACKTISHGQHPFVISSADVELEAALMEQLKPKKNKTKQREPNRSARASKKAAGKSKSPLVRNSRISAGKEAKKAKRQQERQRRRSRMDYDSDEEDSHHGLDGSAKRLVGAGAAHIPESNIGHAMLRKLGWNSGGLGKEQQGISHPIEAVIKSGRKGLGS